MATIPALLQQASVWWNCKRLTPPLSFLPTLAQPSKPRMAHWRRDTRARLCALENLRNQLYLRNEKVWDVFAWAVGESDVGGTAAGAFWDWPEDTRCKVLIAKLRALDAQLARDWADALRHLALGGWDHSNRWCPMLLALPSMSDHGKALAFELMLRLAEWPTKHFDRSVEVGSKTREIDDAELRQLVGFLLRSGADGINILLYILDERTLHMVATVFHSRLPGLEHIVQCLRSEFAPVRFRACRLLGVVSDPRPLHPLLSALADSDWRVAHQAAMSLKELHYDVTGSEATLRVLLHSLESEDAAERASAASCLQECGWIPASVDHEIAYAIARKDFAGAARYGLVAAPRLHKILEQEKEEGIRSATVEALGEHGDSSSVDAIVSALGKQDVRFEAIEALAQISDRCDPSRLKRVEFRLATMLHSKEIPEQTYVDALGAIGTVSTIVPLLEIVLLGALRVVPGSERIPVALRVIPGSEGHPLEDYDLRNSALAVVTRIAESPASDTARKDRRLQALISEILTSAASGRYRAVGFNVEACASAIGRIATPVTVQPLRDYLLDRYSIDYTNRRVTQIHSTWFVDLAIGVLGSFGDTYLDTLCSIVCLKPPSRLTGREDDASPVINYHDFNPVNIATIQARAIQDRHFRALSDAFRQFNWIKSRALGVLGHLSNPDAVEAISRALDWEWDWARPSVDSSVHLAAVEALGRIGDARGIAPIVGGNWQREIRDGVIRVEDYRSTAPQYALAVRDALEAILKRSAASMVPEDLRRVASLPNLTQVCVQEDESRLSLEVTAKFHVSLSVVRDLAVAELKHRVGRP